MLCVVIDIGFAAPYYSQVLVLLLQGNPHKTPRCLWRHQEYTRVRGKGSDFIRKSTGANGTNRLPTKEN